MKGVVANRPRGGSRALRAIRSLRLTSSGIKAAQSMLQNEDCFAAVRAWFVAIEIGAIRTTESKVRATTKCNWRRRARSAYETGRGRLVRGLRYRLMPQSIASTISAACKPAAPRSDERRERWIVECCTRDIIEAPHRAILWDSLAGMIESANNRKGQNLFCRTECDPVIASDSDRFPRARDFNAHPFTSAFAIPQRS